MLAFVSSVSFSGALYSSSANATNMTKTTLYIVDKLIISKFVYDQ